MAKLFKVFCKKCKKPIFRTRRRINENLKLGNNFYCSRKCESEYKTKRKKILCENCGKKFLRQLNDISPHNYCSQSCAAQVNNKKYPKRHPELLICTKCGQQFKKSSHNQKYCSLKCWKETKWHTPEKIIKIIQDAYKKSGRVPVNREMKGIGTASKKFFGSWNRTIIAAGLQPNRSHDHRMYKRTNTVATDGHLCDSASEALIDNWLTKNNIFHEKNASYPETNHKADWAIKSGKDKTFVEYFGLANDSPRYDRSIKEKKRLCKKHRISLIAIYPKDLYQGHINTILDNKFGSL